MDAEDLASIDSSHSALVLPTQDKVGGELPGTAPTLFQSHCVREAVEPGFDMLELFRRFLLWREL